MADSERRDDNRHDALFSVYDKGSVAEFAQELQRLGNFRLISTGGTAEMLKGAGLEVTLVEDITQFPSMLGGRVKTLHPNIHGGILADLSKPNHVAELSKYGIRPIDVVLVDLYPFEETIAKENVTKEEAVEQIDIGGVTLLRAAAKNHKRVVTVFDKADYLRILEAYKTSGEVPEELRQELAAKAISHTSFYDAQIARYLNRESFPDELTFPLRKVQELRYGDNPDQGAVLYMFPNTDAPLSRLQKLAGRELSATNVTDIDAGIKSVRGFEEPAAVVIKHNTPCGIALGETEAEALARALESDSESAFGGVVVMNRPMTLEAAEKIAAFKEAGKGQMDIVAVPGIEEEALDLLKKIRKTTGIYTFGSIPPNSPDRRFIRWVDGGFIIQAENDPISSFPNWKAVTEKKPSPQQLEQMQRAWKFIGRIRSNTVVVIDRELPMTRGIGTGQTSRVLATEIALGRAGEYTKGGILASDSFFPKPDSVKLAGEKGIAAIVQQGGSINDQASINAANELGIAMVLTGQRLFWH